MSSRKRPRDKEEEQEEFDSEGIPYEKEHLPYGGDLNKARNNKDINAIKLITKWKQKYERKQEKRKKERQIPEIAKDCRNEKNYVTMEHWSEENRPEFFIKFLDPGGFNLTECYTRNELETYLNDKGNNFAGWIPPPGFTLDENGQGVDPNTNIADQNAEPSKIERFVEIPIRKLVIRHTLYDILEQNIYKSIAVPCYETRIGNLEASYAMNRQHGQAPDQMIYYLVPEGFSEREALNIVYEKIYCTKTSTNPQDERDKTFEDIRNIHNEFPIAQVDIRYYYLKYSLRESLEGCIPTDINKILPIEELEMIDEALVNIVDNQNVSYEETETFDWIDINDDEYERYDFLKNYSNRMINVAMGYLIKPSESRIILYKIIYALYKAYAQDLILTYNPRNISGDGELPDAFGSITFFSKDDEEILERERLETFEDVMTSLNLLFNTYTAQINLDQEDFIQLVDDFVEDATEQQIYSVGGVLLLLSIIIKNGVLIWIYTSEIEHNYAYDNNFEGYYRITEEKNIFDMEFSSKYFRLKTEDNKWVGFNDFNDMRPYLNEIIDMILLVPAIRNKFLYMCAECVEDIIEDLDAVHRKLFTIMFILFGAGFGLAMNDKYAYYILGITRGDTGNTNYYFDNMDELLDRSEEQILEFSNSDPLMAKLLVNMDNIIYDQSFILFNGNIRRILLEKNDQGILLPVDINIPKNPEVFNSLHSLDERREYIESIDEDILIVNYIINPALREFVGQIEYGQYVNHIYNIVNDINREYFIDANLDIGIKQVLRDKGIWESRVEKNYKDLEFPTPNLVGLFILWSRGIYIIYNNPFLSDQFVGLVTGNDPPEIVDDKILKPEDLANFHCCTSPEINLILYKANGLILDLFTDPDQDQYTELSFMNDLFNFLKSRVLFFRKDPFQFWSDHYDQNAIRLASFSDLTYDDRKFLLDKYSFPQHEGEDLKSFLRPVIIDDQ